MKFNHAVIDMDVLVYRCGFAIETVNKETKEVKAEPVHHAYYNINSMMDKIFELTQADTYEGFLTAPGKGNFRFNIYPDYKSNRKDSRRPIYFSEIRDYIISKYEAKIIEGEEADDSCIIEHCSKNSLGWDPNIRNSIVCSIDKDFNNAPGWHLNYIKDEIYYVTEEEALRNFYLQILTGDAADGIPRIKKGWREKQVKADLEKATSEKEMYTIVINEMSKVLDKDLTHRELLDLLTMRGRLVWLRRKPGEMWAPEFLNRSEAT